MACNLPPWRLEPLRLWTQTDFPEAAHVDLGRALLRVPHWAGRASGPDYTLPLRMQSAGRSTEHVESLRLKWILWRRALASSAVWRMALRVTLPVAALQLLLIVYTKDSFPAAILLFLTAIAAVIAGAAATVYNSRKRSGLRRN